MTIDPPVRDWLTRYSPPEWIRAAMRELGTAEKAFAVRNARAGIAGARRAAGMALNGVLAVAFREEWGRSYMDHLVALAKDASAPEAVRTAAKTLLDATPPAAGTLIVLRTASFEERVIEAAKDVIAHAFALVNRYAKAPPPSGEPS
ncbi:MAG: hypothetical protein U0174_10300 [Polyangiaceae bacterium]